MKKILIMATLAFTVSAPLSAMAALITTAGTSLGSAAYSPSTKVTVDIKASATEWAAASGHLASAKAFGMLSSSTNISEYTKTNGTALDDTAVTATNAIALTAYSQ